MTQLGDHLRQLIAAEGPISIATFMQTVLTAREHGYYMQGDPFGALGDFVTAPEISQIFGELIGLWAVAVWEQLGAPPRFSLVELGPGRGTLMRDALRAAKVRPAFLSGADVALVEISPSLRELQRAALVDSGARSVSWHDDFAPAAGQPLIVIANEFFDALPIVQYVATKQGWRERLVALTPSGDLTFVLSPTTMPVGFGSLAAERCVEGAVFEIAPARNALAERIGAAIAAQGGAALVIDYGFAGPAVGNTLQAVKAHQFVPVLDDVGHADVTAHVDFAALAGGLAKGGVDVYGTIEQSQFIERLGGRERLAALTARATSSQRQELESGYLRLTEAKQMGSLFRVLAAVPRGLLPPGFALHERC